MIKVVDGRNKVINHMNEDNRFSFYHSLNYYLKKKHTDEFHLIMEALKNHCKYRFG